MSFRNKIPTNGLNWIEVESNTFQRSFFTYNFLKSEQANFVSREDGGFKLLLLSQTLLEFTFS